MHNYYYSETSYHSMVANWDQNRYLSAVDTVYKTCICCSLSLTGNAYLRCALCVAWRVSHIRQPMLAAIGRPPLFTFFVVLICCCLVLLPRHSIDRYALSERMPRRCVLFDCFSIRFFIAIWRWSSYIVNKNRAAYLISCIVIFKYFMIFKYLIAFIKTLLMHVMVEASSRSVRDEWRARIGRRQRNNTTATSVHARGRSNTTLAGAGAHSEPSGSKPTIHQACSRRSQRKNIVALSPRIVSSRCKPHGEY